MHITTEEESTSADSPQIPSSESIKKVPISDEPSTVFSSNIASRSAKLEERHQLRRFLYSQASFAYAKRKLYEGFLKAKCPTDPFHDETHKEYLLPPEVRYEVKETWPPRYRWGGLSRFFSINLAIFFSLPAISTTAWEIFVAGGGLTAYIIWACMYCSIAIPLTQFMHSIGQLMQGGPTKVMATLNRRLIGCAILYIILTAMDAPNHVFLSGLSVILAGHAALGHSPWKLTEALSQACENLDNEQCTATPQCALGYQSQSCYASSAEFMKYWFANSVLHTVPLGHGFAFYPLIAIVSVSLFFCAMAIASRARRLLVPLTVAAILTSFFMLAVVVLTAYSNNDEAVLLTPTKPSTIGAFFAELNRPRVWGSFVRVALFSSSTWIGKQVFVASYMPIGARTAKIPVLVTVLFAIYTGTLMVGVRYVVHLEALRGRVPIVYMDQSTVHKHAVIDGNRLLYSGLLAHGQLNISNFRKPLDLFHELNRRQEVFHF